ncbi:glycosyltransferase family 2 protein [Acidocella facilis]|uniref:glycosyltransferase family 2 protein n=1 Tax=Acidocella facilis TaxID=525 RepID=UPI001F48C638|nr:glycosyltransferase family 2 protein [Acidocella facilis]
MGKIGCVAIVKNEARHIAEWLAWQFIIGFDTVILLDNGSTDATIAIAQDFALGRDVRVVAWSSTAPDYQIRGYEHIAREMAAEFEWLGFFDADEFLRLDDGLTLKGLLAARPEAAVALPWAIFGSNGHDEFPDGLLVERFTRRAELGFGPNHHVKSIIRPALMESCLNPHAFAMRGDYVDLLGRPVIWGGGPGVLAATPDHQGGSLNHYFVRSRAHWREKMARGYHDLTRPEGEFEAYDRNEVPDERLATRAGELRAMMPKPAKPQTLQAPPASAYRYRFAIAACARWETPYISEWLTYHRAIGFEHVFLYCNDDEPTELYEEILPFVQGPAPFVSFRFFPEQGMHRKMMMHFARHDSGAAQWVSFLDLDEFISLPPGEDLPGFLSRFEERTDCLMFNWLLFGPIGQTTPPKSVLRSLTRHQPHLHPFTKMLFRSCILDRPELFETIADNGFVHQLSDCVNVDIRPLNVLGEDMRQYYRDFPNAANAWLQQDGRAERIMQSGAMIHHYAIRTEDAFRQRVARGLRGDFHGERIWGEIADKPDELQAFLSHINAVEERRLALFWERLVAHGWDNIAELGPAVEMFVAMPDHERIRQALASARVVIVEPDVRAYYALTEQFAAEIAEGRLVVENFAPAARGGEIAMLTPGGGGRAYPVATISWDELVAKHGMPTKVYLGAELPGFGPAPR